MTGGDEWKQEWWHQKRWWLAGLLVVVGLLALVVAGPAVVIRASRPDIGKASAADQLKAENDLRGTLVTVLAGVAVAAGTVVGALNLRETQRQNRESSDLQRRGQVAERFSKAIDQLSKRNPGLDARLGAIYALEQIARDTQDYGTGDLHWPIVEILTAFIREHTKADAGAQPTSEQLEHHESTAGPTVAADIQAALTVLARRDPARDRGHVDLRSANLQGAMLGRANLQGANLYQADLEGAELFEANLQGARLNWANFQEANLLGANLRKALLRGANLRKALLGGANLQGAVLDQANFQDAELDAVKIEPSSAGRNTDLSLPGANLSGVDLSNTLGLTEDQLDSAICDAHTCPPPNVTRMLIRPR